MNGIGLLFVVIGILALGKLIHSWYLRGVILEDWGKRLAKPGIEEKFQITIFKTIWTELRNNYYNLLEG